MVWESAYIYYMKTVDYITLYKILILLKKPKSIIYIQIKYWKAIYQNMVNVYLQGMRGRVIFTLLSILLYIYRIFYNKIALF